MFNNVFFVWFSMWAIITGAIGVPAIKEINILIILISCFTLYLTINNFIKWRDSLKYDDATRSSLTVQQFMADNIGWKWDPETGTMKKK